WWLSNQSPFCAKSVPARPECITALATRDTTFNGGSHRFDREPFRLQLLTATRTCDTSAVLERAPAHRRVGRRDYFDRVGGLPDDGHTNINRTDGSQVTARPEFQRAVIPPSTR